MQADRTSDTAQGPDGRGAPAAPPASVLGTHYLVELRDCDAARLERVDDVKRVMLRAAEESHARIVGSAFHQFQPAGASGVVLIRESHFSIHTWPENRYAAADIFTCGDEMDADVAVRVMADGFGAAGVQVRKIDRGC